MALISFADQIKNLHATSRDARRLVDSHPRHALVLEPGAVIASRYRIKHPLGHGGMGSVYLAADQVLGDDEIAIKVLRRSPQDVLNPHSKDQMVDRFIREVRLTHKINHENVVRTFDIGRDGDLLYYTMEYLPGQTLEVAINQGGLPVRSLIDIAQQIMRGLIAVHSVGVVHRDLKPANIIVASDGTLKLTDFGIARSNTAPQTLGASDVLGTVRYVAPEVLRGETATSAADLYSFGVVLFELLVGRTPFSEVNPAQLILAKIETQVPSIESYRPDLPLWLIRGIDGLLEREPAHRRASAKELSAALDSYLGERRERSYLGGVYSEQVSNSDSQDPLSAKAFNLRRRFGAITALQLREVMLAIMCAVFVLPFMRMDIFQRVDLSLLDSLFRLRGAAKPNSDIVVVSMDEQSYSSLGQPLSEPWPRDLHARLLDRLTAAGAKRVVFDIIFSKRSDLTQGDRELARAMQRVPTVLGAALGTSQRATINGTYSLEELIEPEGVFKGVAAGIGIVGLPQRSGRVSEIPRVQSGMFYNLRTLSEASVDGLILANTAQKKPGPHALINFYGPARAIPTVSYEILLGDSPVEALREIFSGKIVFVGLGLKSSTGAAQRDSFLTPFDEGTYGAEVHATVASNLLNRDWIERLEPWSEGILAIASSIAYTLLAFSFGGAIGFIILAASLLAVVGLTLVFFSSGVFVSLLLPVAWGVFSGLTLRAIFSGRGVYSRIA
jgi:serine/threonine protein kinase